MANTTNSHPDFPAIKLDKMEQELNAEYMGLESGYKTRKANREEAWRRYNFEPYGNEKKNSSKIVDSTIFNAVEWMTPSLIQPFFETSDVIKVIPETAELKDIMAAEYNRELLNYQLRKRMDLYSVYYDTFKTFLISGDAYLKLTWQKKDSKMGEPVGRPLITPVTPDAIRYDWTVKGGFMNSRVVTHDEDWTRSDILGMKGQKGVVDACLDAVLETSGSEMKSTDLRDEQAEDKAYQGEQFTIAEEAKKLYLRREHWTEYDLRGDGRLEPVMAVFINNKLVQVIANPYDFKRPPFVQAECVRNPLGNPAFGWAEILGDIQKFRTAIMRMSSDNLNSQHNGLYEVDHNNVDEVGMQVLMNAPEGSRIGIPVRKPGSINPLQSAPLAPHAFKVWEMLEIAGENRGGFTRYSQGLDSKALNQTATGFVGITQRSEMRLWEVAPRFAEATLKPLLRMVITLNQQMLTPQDIEVQFGIDGRDMVMVDKVTGNQVPLNKNPGELIKIKKEDIAGYFSVLLDLQVGSDKQQKINNLFQFGQYFAPYIGNGVPPEVIGAIATETARLMDLPKVENLVRSNYAGRGISLPALGEAGGDAQAGGGIGGTATESVLSDSVPNQLSGQPLP